MSMPLTCQKGGGAVLEASHAFHWAFICEELPYLQDHVPGEQASISCNDAFSVDVLDEDANQGGFIATDNADGERFRGIHPRDLNTGQFTVGDQVMELRKGQH